MVIFSVVDLFANVNIEVIEGVYIRDLDIIVCFCF